MSAREPLSLVQHVERAEDILADLADQTDHWTPLIRQALATEALAHLAAVHLAYAGSEVFPTVNPPS